MHVRRWLEADTTGIEDDSSAEGKYRRQAYWALGKRRDKNLISFLRERLRIEMSRDPDATYQILIALDDLQEPVFSERREGHYSVLDEELNLDDARAYLRV